MVGRDYFGLSKSELSGIPMVVPGMILGGTLDKKFFKNLTLYIYFKGINIFLLLVVIYPYFSA